MAEYNGPNRSDIIDTPLLAKFFYNLDTLVSKKTKIYVLGGTALTLLGIRKEGSRDVDIVCEEHFHEVNAALGTIKNNMRSGKIFIPIMRNKKEVKRFYFPKDAIIQLFGMNITENMRLPEDFDKFAHKLKVIGWVMPEEGKIKMVSCNELFGNITIYTLGLADIFCSKVFAFRERDREDIKAMIEKRGLYFRWHKKFILGRFQDFWKTNKHVSEDMKRGAIATYNAFQEEYPNHLLQLIL